MKLNFKGHLHISDSTFDDEPSESSGDTRQKKKRGKKRSNIVQN